ncbi:hypothetical protein [Deinococcus humi]|uniref:Putative membrane protein YqiK n=1 Tax=Deinococcus humi TaxID=662880 RepID=A0A7W8JRC3_9DEIO|nr:hypothetical protein [Deinococcus humi]MBB5361790.1 putative membrane protein YqiK [Deinococcus humi]GGO23685.1 hypothetical protein GCM10008949_12050 [Deinococcus humi]
MTLPILIPFLIALGMVLLIIFGLIGLVKAFYIKVDQGTALIVNDLSSSPKVRFTGALVIPVLYKAEIMQISLITLQVDRRGREGLICKDNMRADIAVAYYLRVNETSEDVLKVAKSIGARRASDREAVDELFNAKFSEALKTVGKKFDFIELFEKRDEFRDEVVKVIGRDLNGYVLEDVAIDYLEQTPKTLLDQNNIMDAEGIRKITQLTAAQNIVTNELEQNERLAVTKKNVETREATLSLERQQAEAEARQRREIDTIVAREQAETQKVREEQRLLSEQARIDTDEKVEIREQERSRQVEVAEQNRLRAVAIEIERVTRAGKMEAVTTDREVKLQEVDRDKIVEQGVMEVANITRERIAIQKTVALEEERINEVRQVSAADRDKQVRVLGAEAAAQETLVKQIKAAEAAETASRHRAAEMTNLAQAESDSATRKADAVRVMAAAKQVEIAAPGLAETQVLEAKAEASYKQGNADARVLAERMAAEAQGQAAVGQALASITSAQGSAEAGAVSDRMMAEARGLTAKFGAMDSMSDRARDHEEFRMTLETNLKEVTASLEAGKEVSRETAGVLSSALKNAHIDLVGGEGGMFDALSRSVSMSKAVEGFAARSPMVQALLDRFAGVRLGREETGYGTTTTGAIDKN